MSTTAALYWIHALSPLRVGVEQSLDAINLPTMKEVHTGHPIVPGSSVKGVLRAELGEHQREVSDLFGPDRLNASDHRGALAFTDARLVALPVRSLYGTFAWATSPYLLAQLGRARSEAGLGPLPTFSSDDVLSGALVSEGSKLLYPETGEIFVEEYTAPAKADPRVFTLAVQLAGEIWTDPASREFFIQRLVVLPDDVLNGLIRSGLELRTRVAINPKTGIVETSGPWTEEAMPAETLLCGLVLGRGTVVTKENGVSTSGDRKVDASTAMGALKDLAQGWAKVPLRLGGHNGVGFGRATLRVVGA